MEANSLSFRMKVAPIHQHWWYDQWLSTYDTRSEIVPKLTGQRNFKVQGEQSVSQLVSQLVSSFVSQLVSQLVSYSFLFEFSDSKPSSQFYHKNVFQNSNLVWKTFYMLPRIVTKDSRLRVFQYKLLNNVSYLNKMLFRFGKIDSPLSSL